MINRKAELGRIDSEEVVAKRLVRDGRDVAAVYLDNRPDVQIRALHIEPSLHVPASIESAYADHDPVNSRRAEWQRLGHGKIYGAGAAPAILDGHRMRLQ